MSDDSRMHRGRLKATAAALTFALASFGAISAANPSVRPVGDCHPTIRYSAGQGATGSIWAVFTVTVTSARGCRFRGFPQVRFIDRSDRALPTHPTHQTLGITGIPDRPVVVRRSRPGRFLMIYNFLTVNGQACRPAPHAAVISLPGYPQPSTVSVDGNDPELRVFAPCGGRFVLSPIGI